MAVKLTRRAVVQAKVESVYGVAETLTIDDGILVSEPEFKIDPTVLERDIELPDLSPEAVVLGRRLASMTFKTELRSNGKTTFTEADAPIISRLFRACGYALTEVASPEVLGAYQIGQHANTVSWEVSSGAKASRVLTYTDVPTDGETVTIGAQVYKFKTALTPAANEVLIGADADASYQNLTHAINGTGIPGTHYAAGTLVNTDVSAVFAAPGKTVTVTALAKGAAANAIVTTATTDDATWAGATLTGGINISTAADVVGYAIEITTGGVSGVAQARVIATESPTQAEVIVPPATLTSGTPFVIADGLTMTPTFTGVLTTDQRWMLWALPKGLRLDPVSENFESVTLAMNKDGILHSMPGSFGTFQITAEAGQYASVEWTFTGKWVDPVDAPFTYPTFEKTLPAQVEVARLRIDNFYAVVAKFTYDQANDINVRPDVSSPEGYIGTRITARNPKGGIDPEADTVANQDFWAKLGSAKRMPFQMRVGKNAGNIVWVFAPSTQYTGLTYQDRDGILTFDAELRFSRYNGNDEFCLFFM
ncbi:phage tail tube protein [Hyphomicrobium sp. ghe19]|uniref:phage tail tube protein n=1 Tax=Hyphomicrobium sp. ghe19 TaxID=2682968 RepID=UPI0013668E97|nr:hypothetical protein HYPP_02501 [Hyphomicrobium sp. ghe19]